MKSEQSMTGWLDVLRLPDAEAAQQLWEWFFARMKELARRRSRPCLTGGAYDEEDVAVSAFANFWFALRAGNYDRLGGPDELWRLLARFTLREANQYARRARARKRCAAGPVRHLSLGEIGEEGQDNDQPIDQALPPDLRVLTSEQCQHLLARLEDADLQAVARWRLEGHTNDEIATLLGSSRRTVQRQLRVIRRRLGGADELDAAPRNRVRSRSGQF